MWVGRCWGPGGGEEGVVKKRIDPNKALRLPLLLSHRDLLANPSSDATLLRLSDCPWNVELHGLCCFRLVPSRISHSMARGRDVFT